MKTYDMPQQTPEWFKVKLGKISASNFKCILAKGEGKGRNGYMNEVAAEVLTGEKKTGYSDKNMERGNELELFARIEYSKIYGVDVEQVGWVEQESERTGCSPDGLVSSEGMVEFKCPIPTTHISYCRKKEGWTPPEYKAQLQGQMWVCEREWVDFMSYCPEINGRYFLCVRVCRDEEYIKNLSEECDRFLAELDEVVEKMRKTF